MTFARLIVRNLRFHARAHLGVALGAAIGSAVLVGALVVGDSMRASLRQMALNRLGPIHFAVSTRDRLFQDTLSRRIDPARSNELHCATAAGLVLSGTVTVPETSKRANRVAVVGVETPAWPLMAGWAGLSTTGQEPTPPASETTLQTQFDRSDSLLARWRRGELALLNQTLASQLGVRPGDDLIVRVRKPSDLALDAAVRSSETDALALRLKVGAILPGSMLGDFSLSAQATPPPNVFLPLPWLAEKTGAAGRANLLIFTAEPAEARANDRAASDRLSRQLRAVFQLEDAGLALNLLPTAPAASTNSLAGEMVELASRRLFIEPGIEARALRPAPEGLLPPQAFASNLPGTLQPSSFITNGIRTFTYLANLIRAGERATPYSMVTAADAPLAPPDLRPDEILLNDWLATDLKAAPGDRLELSYYAVDSASRLIEQTNSFRVRAIVPMRGVYADRTLMPAFPGLAEVESTHDWSPAFPLRYKLRPQDEAYWKTYRGTPKAFITLAAGQAMWSNRFGTLTAIRYPAPPGVSGPAWRQEVRAALTVRLEPAALGLRLEPVRQQALQAAEQGQDFGQLFLGFSFFLLAAALLLMGLLFQLGLEQRASEIGTLLALGFTERRVRRLILLEGAGLAWAGGVIGSFAGLGYARVMLWGLSTLWRDAAAGATLRFHAAPATLLLGFCASTVVATLVLWLALRRMAGQSIQSLLTGQDGTWSKPPPRDGTSRAYSSSLVQTGKSALRLRAGPASDDPALHTPHSALRTPHWLALGSGASALVLVAWAWFSGGRANVGAFFGAGSLMLAAGLAGVAAWLRALAENTRPEGLTSAGLALRGCARRRGRSLATVSLLACGGFLIVAVGAFRLEATSDAARPESGTGGFAWIGESASPVVRDLNTEAGREYFGLEAADLAGARVIALRVHEGDEASCLNLNRAQQPRLLGVNPRLLRGRFTFTQVAAGARRQDGWDLLAQAGDEIPAIGDANSIEWALGRKLGDTLDCTDELGRPFKVRLVGALANSILQGGLIIDEARFLKRFPATGGYRLLLIDAPAKSAQRVSSALGRALQDLGLELTPAARRLNAFNAVQNTYLGTFQMLGGLGLLLGSAGLGLVVARNVLERRGELALLVAVGFRKRTLRRLVLGEHLALLCAGLGIGLTSALVAVLPAILTPGARFPYASLALTLSGVLLNGAIFAWLAARYALRGDLLPALRNE